MYYADTIGKGSESESESVETDNFYHRLLYSDACHIWTPCHHGFLLVYVACLSVTNLLCLPTVNKTIVLMERLVSCLIRTVAQTVILRSIINSF